MATHHNNKRQACSRAIYRASYIKRKQTKKATLVVFFKKPTNTKIPNKLPPQQAGERLTKNQKKQPKKQPTPIPCSYSRF